MKEQFIEKTFIARNLSVIDYANSIIEDYQAQGYSLTLRQLYYQFVSRDLIENTQKSYDRLGSIITDARMAGLVDWNAIEDRTRNLSSWLIEEDIETALNGIEYHVAFDYWKRQGVYVEVWVEKEALADVIRKACIEYSVPYLSCRGYLSASEAYKSGKRFEKHLNQGDRCVLIHLGDHDPSGVDMTRDNKERVDMFSWSQQVEIRRIALNMNQVKEYSPPPNPAKLSDSRAKGYIKRYGRQSWELDALEPSLLKRLIQDEIKSLIDFDVWKQTQNDQAERREKLILLTENWGDIEEFITEQYSDNDYE